jgi:flagellar biosynthesis/type III secretory pathway protein FliH
MSSSSSVHAARFVEDAFAFDQLPPAPPAPRQIDPQFARDEAAAIVAAAQAEADAIREQARAEGHAKGLAAAREHAAAQAAPALQALGEALVQAQTERDRVSVEVEAAAVELALEIAEKALTTALAVRPELVLDVVRGALRCLVDRERVLILVHPEDLELVREAVDSLVRQLGGIEHIEVQEERRVQRGGAIVRSTAGEIDARVQTKLENAREILEHELSKSAAA